MRTLIQLLHTKHGYYPRIRDFPTFLPPLFSNLHEDLVKIFERRRGWIGEQMTPAYAGEPFRLSPFIHLLLPHEIYNIMGRPPRPKSTPTDPTADEEEKFWRWRAANLVDNYVADAISHNPLTYVLATDGSSLERKQLTKDLTKLHLWDTGILPASSGSFACWDGRTIRQSREQAQPLFQHQWCAHRWAHSFSCEARSFCEGVTSLLSREDVQTNLRKGAQRICITDCSSILESMQTPCAEQSYYNLRQAVRWLNTTKYRYNTDIKLIWLPSHTRDNLDEGRRFHMREVLNTLQRHMMEDEYLEYPVETHHTGLFPEEHQWETGEIPFTTHDSPAPSDPPPHGFPNISSHHNNMRNPTVHKPGVASIANTYVDKLCDHARYTSTCTPFPIDTVELRSLEKVIETPRDIRVKSLIDIFTRHKDTPLSGELRRALKFLFHKDNWSILDVKYYDDLPKLAQAAVRIGIATSLFTPSRTIPTNEVDEVISCIAGTTPNNGNIHPPVEPINHAHVTEST